MTTIVEKVARSLGIGKAAHGRADPADYPDEPPEVANKLACYDTYRYQLSNFRDKAKDMHRSCQSALKEVNDFQQVALGMVQERKSQELDFAIRGFAELTMAREQHDRKMNDSLYRLLVEPLDNLLDKEVQSVEALRNRYTTARSDFNKLNVASTVNTTASTRPVESRQAVEPDLQMASRHFEQAKSDLLSRIDAFEKNVNMLFQNNLKQFLSNESEFCKSCNSLLQSLSSRQTEVSSQSDIGSQQQQQQPSSSISGISSSSQQQPSSISSSSSYQQQQPSSISSSSYQQQQQPSSGSGISGGLSGNIGSHSIGMHGGIGTGQQQHHQQQQQQPISSSQHSGYSGLSSSSGMGSGLSGASSSQYGSSSQQSDVSSIGGSSVRPVTHYGAQQSGKSSSSDVPFSSSSVKSSDIRESEKEKEKEKRYQ